MLSVKNPYNQKLIKEIEFHQSSDVENALETAYELFQNPKQWIPAYERVQLLERLAELMKNNIENLTITAASEGGKPYVDSRAEILRAINGIETAKEEIGRLAGEQIPMGHTASSVNRLAYTKKEPIGVVVGISAFNHPVNLIIHQAVTAFAAGCPVIIKPALKTPLSAILFIDLMHEAGIPKKWCQCLIVDNELTQALASDSRVNYVSFIGSEKVGWKLRGQLAAGTRIALEHGGVAPVIVEADAVFENMIPALAKGAYYHAGQVCVSVQKIYVHQSIGTNFISAFKAKVDTLVVGDPLDKATEVGPIILKSELERIDKWVKEAVEAGGELICGGYSLSETTYAPTIILNPPENVNLSTHEVFGPVACIYTFSDRNEAISKANALPYHFQAAVFTESLESALDVTNRINAAAVMVNDHTAFRVDWMPFGGRDASGLGVGGIKYSMLEMSRDKLIVIKSKQI